MRAKREMIMGKLQEELKAKVNLFLGEKMNFELCWKEEELNRIRVALDEVNYHQKQQASTELQV